MPEIKYEVIIGLAERNVIGELSNHGSNHRTYAAADALWTGTESYESKYACSDECRDKILAPYPVRSTVIDSFRGEVPVALDSRALSGEHRKVEDATVYDDPETPETDMLPAVCAACETVLIPAPVDDSTMSDEDLRRQEEWLEASSHPCYWSSVPSDSPTA